MDRKDNQILKKIGDSMSCEEKTVDYSETARFFVLLIAGVVAIIASKLMTNNSVSSGLALGGLFSVLMAIYLNWSNMAEALKVIILGLVLGLFIFSPALLLRLGIE